MEENITKLVHFDASIVAEIIYLEQKKTVAQLRRKYIDNTFTSYLSERVNQFFIQSRTLCRPGNLKS